MAGIVLAAVCALGLVGLGDLRIGATEAIVVMMLWGVVISQVHPRGGRAWMVFAAALLVRGILLSSPPTLSDDLFRYLWEGRASLSGGNPYLTPPADPSWPADAIRALVNHPTVSSIYPPLAQWLFAALGSIFYDPLSIKGFMGLCDALVAGVLASILAGRGRSMAGAWIYALHPLAAVESAGSGHLEAAALLCVVLAIRAWDRGGSGAVWAGIGANLKLLPAAVMVTLLRRNPRRIGVVAVITLAALWPFLDAGALLGRGLSTYAEHWSFNASLFGLFEWMFDEHARPITMVCGAAVCVWALLRRRDPAEVSLWVGGAFVLLSPTVHPWYIAWVWVPALICGVRSFTLLATLAPLSYAVLATYDPQTGRWAEPAWTVWAVYLPFFGALAWETVLHRMRPGPWAPDVAEVAEVADA
ncbi:MAG: hypothetical protein ACI8RZ_004255 [Myxococcota bacterium]|jgi:hypothetical protein